MVLEQDSSLLLVWLISSGILKDGSTIMSESLEISHIGSGI